MTEHEQVFKIHTHSTPLLTQDLFIGRVGGCITTGRDNHYIAHHNPKDPLVVVAVHFDYLDMDGHVVNPPDVRLHRRIRQLEFFIHLLERLEKSWHASQTDQTNIRLAACLAEINQQDRQAQQNGYKRQQAVLIDEICRETQTHPEKCYSVEDLAGQLNFTRRHFSRLFKQTSGVWPQDFIVRARIEAAKGKLCRYLCRKLCRLSYKSKWAAWSAAKRQGSR